MTPNYDKIRVAFAVGRPTAKDDLIRALADVLYGRDPDTDKVCAARGLLESAYAGAAERRRSFDVEVD